MPTPTKPIDPAMLSWAEQRYDRARELVVRAIDAHGLWQERYQQILNGRPTSETITEFEDWRSMQPREEKRDEKIYSLTLGVSSIAFMGSLRLRP